MNRCSAVRNAWLSACLALLASSCGSPANVPMSHDTPAVPLGRLPEGVRPLHYQLELSILPEHERFEGIVEISLELDVPADGIWLHGQNLEVSELYADTGTARVPGTWTQRTDDGVVRIAFSEPLPAGRATLHVEYEAEFNEQLRGLYRVESGGNLYAFTQFEATSARAAFPGFDEPRFKTPFDVILTVPKAAVAAANTPVERTLELPGSLRRVEYMTTAPLPTYLLAWAVGPFDVVEGEPLPGNAIRQEAVPFRGIAVRGQGPKLQHALAHTAAFVEALETYFGIPYPYRKLDVVAVPDFAAGAMENVGLITFRESLLLLSENAPESQRRAFAYVMAHELAHQWFGNLVTMPWWNDIWLNESFATWMGNKVVQELHPEYRSDLSTLAYTHGAMDFDSLTSAHRIRRPVRDHHDIHNAFSAITYQKGGAVLEMFEQWMGFEHFRQAIQLYLRRHANGTASATDLLAALNAVDERDIATAFRTFLAQPGVPLLTAELRCDEHGASIKLAQERYFPVGSKGDPDRSWMIPICLRDGFSEPCLLLEEPAATRSLDRCPSWWMPNRDGAGYFRFSLDDKSRERLRDEGFAQLSDREKLAVVDSLNAAFDQASIDAAQWSVWFPILARSELRQLSTAPMGPLDFMANDAAPEASKDDVQRYARRLYAPLYRSLGWRSRPGDSSDDKLTRESLMNFLVMDVRDPGARKHASELGLLYLKQLRRGNDEPPVAPELGGLILAAAVQVEGEPVFQALWELFRTSGDALLRSRILGALGHSEGRLAERALALSLDPNLRLNEVSGLLGPSFRSPETRTLAWDWLRANFDRYLSRVGADLAARAPWYTSSFCTEASVDEVRTFFEPRIAELPGGPRNLAGTLETIALCAALVQAQRPSVVAFFTEPRSTKVSSATTAKSKQTGQ